MTPERDAEWKAKIQAWLSGMRAAIEQDERAKIYQYLVKKWPEAAQAIADGRHETDPPPEAGK